jgi:hypothetical protein
LFERKKKKMREREKSRDEGEREILTVLNGDVLKKRDKRIIQKNNNLNTRSKGIREKRRWIRRKEGEKRFNRKHEKRIKGRRNKILIHFLHYLFISLVLSFFFPYL